jgi:hypothetical protein
LWVEFKNSEALDESFFGAKIPPSTEPSRSEPFQFAGTTAAELNGTI